MLQRIVLQKIVLQRVVLQRVVLQRVVRTAQYITGAKLPAIQNPYTRRCQRKALKMVKGFSHPSYRLFSLYCTATTRQAVPEHQV